MITQIPNNINKLRTTYTIIKIGGFDQFWRSLQSKLQHTRSGDAQNCSNILGNHQAWRIGKVFLEFRGWVQMTEGQGRVEVHAQPLPRHYLSSPALWYLIPCHGAGSLWERKISRMR